ncbi:DNA polymerase III subunit beta [Algicola sagamiensis]|uniref:DNA polymerase III subunit beta n=1 Tax=Algicola sagamiensis TaxID=163869 RepID=UPI0003709216|nr:DNA polymerase III subunit beta [Algicola sagamiensis]
MKFTILRDDFLKPLNMVCGAVERKSTQPILSNVLLKAQDGTLQLTGTDLEIELVASAVLSQIEAPGQVTVPAKKLLDIIKSLPEGCDIQFELQAESAVIRSGRSRFSLSSLPAENYPNLDDWSAEFEFSLSRLSLRQLIESTQFSMANQDVRYYLNGLFFEVEGSTLRTVATDGHRLALDELTMSQTASSNKQIIVPRKGVLEVLRLLESDDEQVQFQIGKGHIRIVDTSFIFTSKLVDGRFPDYRRVLPRQGDKEVVASRELLKSAFVRASILSNEKFRGVRLNLNSGIHELTITANNPEQEQAEDVVELVQYVGGELEVGFNVGYLLDVLNTIRADEVKLTLSDSNSSALIESMDESQAMYVVMPMRL